MHPLPTETTMEGSTAGTEILAEGIMGEQGGATTTPRTLGEGSAAAEVEEEAGVTVVVTEAGEEVVIEIQTVTPEVEEGIIIVVIEVTLTVTGTMEVVQTVTGVMVEVAATAISDSMREPTVVIGAAIVIMVITVTVLIMEALIDLTPVATTEIMVAPPATTVPTIQATRTRREAEVTPTSTMPGMTPTATGKGARTATSRVQEAETAWEEGEEAVTHQAEEVEVVGAATCRCQTIGRPRK